MDKHLVPMVTEIIHPSEELLRGPATNNQEKLIVYGSNAVDRQRRHCYERQNSPQVRRETSCGAEMPTLHWLAGHLNDDRCLDSEASVSIL
jgi:hypothetical protein